MTLMSIRSPSATHASCGCCRYEVRRVENGGAAAGGGRAFERCGGEGEGAIAAGLLGVGEAGGVVRGSVVGRTRVGAWMVWRGKEGVHVGGHFLISDGLWIEAGNMRCVMDWWVGGLVEMWCEEGLAR